MMRLLFVVMLSVFNLLFEAVSAAPMYEGQGQQRSLPPPKAGEVEGLFNSERGPDAGIQVLTLESGTQHALEALISGDYGHAIRWARATKEFLATSNKPIPKWLGEIEKRAAAGEISNLLEKADLAIHQARLPDANDHLRDALSISKEHNGVMETEIKKMLPRSQPGYCTLLWKDLGDKQIVWGYRNYKI